VATAQPSVADWRGGGSNCPLAQAMDGRIMCCDIIAYSNQLPSAAGVLVANPTHLRYCNETSRKDRL